MVSMLTAQVHKEIGVDLIALGGFTAEVAEADVAEVVAPGECFAEWR